MSTEEIKETSPSKKIIAFYLGYSPSFNPNDPDNNSKECYGSELCTKNVAEYLSKEYDVHIFLATNYQSSTYNNVTYHNFTRYNQFQNEYEIDILIISRYIHFFVQSIAKAKKVLFWCHDITTQPWFDSRRMPEEGAFLLLNNLNYIDHFICLTNTHRGYVLNWLQNVRKLTDEELQKFIVIGNGVEPKYFEEDEKHVIQKIPNKFIWCSDPNRGLEGTLDILQDLYHIDNSITLDIFHSKLSEELQKKIFAMPFVTFRGKVTQAELAKEMQSADFWLYACTFYETYCMVGLECQFAGVIPIVKKYGGLIDTVGDRGILVEGNDKFDENMKKAVLDFMSDPKKKEEYRKKCKEWAGKQSYEEIVKVWKGYF
jgi:glycosyltransferase involved in cell wall biosynthesis